MTDLWRDFWIREIGTGQQVAQLHDRYMMMSVNLNQSKSTRTLICRFSKTEFNRILSSTLRSPTSPLPFAQRVLRSSSFSSYVLHFPVIISCVASAVLGYCKAHWYLIFNKLWAKFKHCHARAVTRCSGVSCCVCMHTLPVYRHQTVKGIHLNTIIFHHLICLSCLAILKEIISCSVSLTLLTARFSFPHFPFFLCLSS